MNRRLMTVLSFALVLALGVSFLVYRVMGKKMAECAAGAGHSRHRRIH